MDINIALKQLNKEDNNYRLSSNAPDSNATIVYWASGNPDTQPTTSELTNAWNAYLTANSGYSSEVLDPTISSAGISDNSITNAKMADDAIGLAELSATGTPSSSNFLRGDNTWAAASQTAAEVRTLVDSATDSNVFTDADHTKLDGIETSADVTDATNVASAGAMMTTGGTFSANVTFQKEITENTYECTGTVLDPVNGTVQYKTLGANTTFTEGLAAGQSMLIQITAGSYTATFPTITWAGGSAPTLSTSKPTAIELWKIGSTLYGANVGDLG